jgi:hypothetical protein
MLPGPGGARHRVSEACALALDLQNARTGHFEGMELANLRPAIPPQYIDQQADLLADPDVGLGLDRSAQDNALIRCAPGRCQHQAQPEGEQQPRQGVPS